MPVIHLDATNFEKEVVQSKIPVIIDFWASWCTPCMMMAPIFEDASKEYIGKLKFAKLNTEEAPEYAARYSISSIPCLIIAVRGKEIKRIIGFLPKEALMEKINDATDKA